MDIERLKELKQQVFDDFQLYKVTMQNSFEESMKEVTPTGEMNEVGNDLTSLIDEAIARQSVKSDIGETSDGYHTFNELYEHRTALFATLCNMRSDISWKSMKHDDGTMYDGMFIAGIETPDGQYTYHCDMKYLYMFAYTPEVDKAPPYDGHQPKDYPRLLGLSESSLYRQNRQSATSEEVAEAIELFEGAIKYRKDQEEEVKKHYGGKVPDFYLDLNRKEALAITALQAYQPWISVQDRLPEDRRAVLVWEPMYENIFTMYLEEGQWFFFGGGGMVNYEITHWKPLPEPPKGE